MSFLQSCLELESLELEWLERQTVQVEKKRAEALSPGSTSFSLRLLKKDERLTLHHRVKQEKSFSHLLLFQQNSVINKNHQTTLGILTLQWGTQLFWRTPPNPFFFWVQTLPLEGDPVILRLRCQVQFQRLSRHDLGTVGFNVRPF